MSREEDALQAQDDATRRFRPDALLGDAIRGPRHEGVLTMLKGPSPGFVYTLELPSLTIGRSADADIVIADDGLSRMHARLLHDQRGFMFEDMNSTNGSFVGGKRVIRPVTLADGERITIGENTVLGFSLHDRIELDAARMTHDLTMRDPLTRLYNRRHLNDRLVSEVAYARRHDVALSVLLVDLDHFKQVNDRFGHVTGDHVLKALSATLQAIVRTEDVVARYGGEEFIVIARAIDLNGALVFGERIRTAVAAMEVQGPEGPLRVTASVGIGHAPPGLAAEAVPLLETADGALYRAKSQGRDCVVMRQPRPAARKSGPVPRGG